MIGHRRGRPGPMKVLLPASNLPCNVLVTLLRCLGIITAVTSFVPSPSLTTKDDQQSVLQVSCNGCGPCTRRIPTRGTGRTPWQYFSGASSDMTSELAVARYEGLSFPVACKKNNLFTV